MDNSFIRVDFSEIEWNMSREKVYRKDADFYNGIRMNMVHFEPGHTAWPHSHAAEQNIFVLEGACKVKIEGREHYLKAGCIVSVPSWAEHEVAAADEPVTLISVFSPVDNIPESRPEVLPDVTPYVFDTSEYKWTQVRDKVKRKVYQGSEHFTFAYVQLDPGHAPTPHNHEDIQIVFCVNNKTTYYVESDPLSLSKNVAIATAPWVVHNSHNTFDEPVTDFEIFWPKRPGFTESEK